MSSVSIAADVAAKMEKLAQEAVLKGATKLASNLVVSGMVPFDEGTLQNSFASATAVQPVAGSHGAAVATVGSQMVYARYQHDNMLNHPKQGTDHYLSKAVDQFGDEVMQTMTAVIRKGIG